GSGAIAERIECVLQRMGLRLVFHQDPLAVDLADPLAHAGEVVLNTDLEAPLPFHVRLESEGTQCWWHRVDHYGILAQCFYVRADRAVGKGASFGRRSAARPADDQQLGGVFWRERADNIYGEFARKMKGR